MASRLKLHEEFCEILGTRNVYFQPPATVKMKYPCIKYSLAGESRKRANNQNYSTVNRYEVIVIDSDPDSDIPNKVGNHFQMCSFDRAYVADNLNHRVYTIYY